MMDRIDQQMMTYDKKNHGKMKMKLLGGAKSVDLIGNSSL